MCRLGHSLIDLWTVYVNQVGRLDARAADRVGHESAAFAAGVLDLLDQQRNQPAFTAWRELHEAAVHFDLIVDTNMPSLWARRLAEMPSQLASLLGRQQPVGGMSGTAQRTQVVRQFRMPGYPLALITTDVLQEGEDLHLFCSRVIHYGISWMPSSMEQRIGRIDRVRSQTERRLMRLDENPEGKDLLQVFYPYLPDTFEVFQVERVFERLNRFMRLMHERFGESDDDRDRKIDLRFEAQQKRDIAPVTEPLRSAFPVRRELITGPKSRLAVSASIEAEMLNRFQSLKELSKQMPIQWHGKDARNSLLGTLCGERQQAFTLLLHSIQGVLNVRCVSPVGRVDPRVDTERIARETRPIQVRIGAVYDARFQRYDLTAEGDVLLGRPSTDAARVAG